MSAPTRRTAFKDLPCLFIVFCLLWLYIEQENLNLENSKNEIFVRKTPVKIYSTVIELLELILKI